MTNSINCVNFQGKEVCSNSKAEAARRWSTLLAVEKRWSNKGRAVRTGRASVGNGQTLRILPTCACARRTLQGWPLFRCSLTHAYEEFAQVALALWGQQEQVQKTGQYLYSAACMRVRGSWLEMVFVQRASLPALVAYTMLRSAALILMHY